MPANKCWLLFHIVGFPLPSLSPTRSWQVALPLAICVRGRGERVGKRNMEGAPGAQSGPFLIGDWHRVGGSDQGPALTIRSDLLKRLNCL